jgi:hypothetical protein
MSEQSEASLNNMTIFTLSTTILLMCMRTRDPMRDTNILEESIQLNILITPVRMNIQNFMFQETLYMRLELQENIKEITLAFNKI